MSFYHTQDFTITVLLHHIENLRYKTIQEHVVSLLSNNYCAVFVVHFWSVFDITSMPWHKRPHLNLCCPQFLNLSFYLSHTKDRRSPAKLFSTPSAAAIILYTLTVDTYTHTRTHVYTHTDTQVHVQIYNTDRQRVFRPTYPHRSKQYTPAEDFTIGVISLKKKLYLLKAEVGLVLFSWGNKMQPIVYNNLMKYLLFRV